MWKNVYGELVRPRKHGFEWPLDTLQVTAWGLVLYDIIMWYMLIAYMFHTTAVIVLNTIYTLTGCVLLTLMIALTLMCNEDEAVFGAKLEDDAVIEVGCGRKLCLHCRAVVAMSSKHCNGCDKCVVGFDHHCRWLNTCIGAKNYRCFVAFVTIVFSAVTFQGVVSLFVFISCLVDSAFYKERLRIAYGTACIPAYLVFLCISIASLCFVSHLTAHLLVFHARLAANHQTTYDVVKALRVADGRPPDSGSMPRHRPRPSGCCFGAESDADSKSGSREPVEPIVDVSAISTI